MGGCVTTADNEMANPLGIADRGNVEPQLYVDDGLSHLVELHISCQNLADLDVMSKSDPMAVLMARKKPDAPWEEVGRTEYIMNNLNPKFVTAISLKFFFEQKQEMQIELYLFLGYAYHLLSFVHTATQTQTQNHSQFELYWEIASGIAYNEVDVSVRLFAHCLREDRYLVLCKSYPHK